MFEHGYSIKYTVLGFLREKEALHGYEVAKRHRHSTGQKVNLGNIYRVLRELALANLVKPTPAHEDADQRQRPYLITGKGEEVFDAWLGEATPRGDFASRVLFLNRLSEETRDALLRRWELILEGRIRELQVLQQRKRGEEKMPCLLLQREIYLLRAEIGFLHDVWQSIFSHKKEHQHPEHQH